VVTLTFAAVWHFPNLYRGGRQINTIAVRWGRLRVRTLAFEVAANATPGAAAVKIGGRPVAAELNRQGRRCLVKLTAPVTVEREGVIEVTLV